METGGAASKGRPDPGNSRSGLGRQHAWQGVAPARAVEVCWFASRAGACCEEWGHVLHTAKNWSTFEPVKPCHYAKTCSTLHTHTYTA